MSSFRIGLLAEDETDCDAIGVLIRRTLSGVCPTNVGFKKYWGKGCAKLRKKAESKIKMMANDRCFAAVLVHDLDRNPQSGELNNEAELRAQLERIEVPSGLPRLVCIPVEELEAWFWSDPSLIQEVGRGKGSDCQSPHLIRKPKEELIRLSIGANKKPRCSTNDNKDLANKLNLALCAERCPAFRDLTKFVIGLFPSGAAASTGAT